MTLFTASARAWRGPLGFSALLGVFALAGCNPSSSNPGAPGGAANGPIKLLNVSYDPTRELYAEFDKTFAAYYKKKTGKDVDIKTTHGGSGKQSLKVVKGVDADVVTLALAYDIDAIANAGKMSKDWQKALSDNSTPYTSTIVFLVRKGNPKGIKDWGDLIRPGVGVVTPDPKVSGGARWSYLAAWGWALKQPGGNEAKAKAFIAQLYKKNVVDMPSGARAATDKFTSGTGDVLLDWENEAMLATRGDGASQYQVVTPSTSILAEPPVAVVDGIAKKHGTTEVATEYLKYLYQPEGQEIAAKNFYRPRDTKVAAKYASTFPKIKLWTLDSVFGSWTKAQKTHFANGGVFDQISQGG